MDSLSTRTEQFIAHSADFHEYFTLLSDCVISGTLEGMACVQRLYSDEYDGFTYNSEFKSPAGVALLCWKEIGVNALCEAALNLQTFKNISICFQVLASVAAVSKSLTRLMPVYDEKVVSVITEILKDRHLSKYCRSKLVEFILSLPEDNIWIQAGTSLMALSFGEIDTVHELIRALSARTLTVSRPILDSFEKLMVTHPDDEQSFQVFLTKHPQLLDPIVHAVWPQPNIHGAKEPDFVVRRSDNSYLIIEIESPAKPLITSSTNQLTAEVTHAEKQVTDYRSFLMHRFQEAQSHFPDFDEPDCLVVIGMEGALTLEQSAALRDANRQRHRLKIVGFDWLLKRSTAVLNNIIQSGVDVSQLRII